MISRALAVLAVLLTNVFAAGAQALSPRNANYTIDVRLDTRGRTLTGRQTLVWTNSAPVPATELQFHLYYNAWRNDSSTWMREYALTTWFKSWRPRARADFGSIDISSLKVMTALVAPVDLTKQMRFIAPDDGNANDRTVMAVALPAAIGPGQKATVEIEFTVRIPRPYARTGVVGDNYFIAHWFPKLGVFEPTGRWNCHQFHVGTEFFADFGVYDVRMTVPSGWLLAATGRERERTDNKDGTSTHRYYQEDVHDFAWTTSPHFVERRERFEHPSLPAVDMRLMLQPHNQSQAERHFEAARATLRLYGEWFGAYPYGHMTIVDPPWDSGFEGME